MKIVRSIYVETVEILVLGASRWRKQGLEAEIEEGEDVVAASRELKSIVDKIQKLNNEDVDIPPVPPLKVKVDPMLARMRVLIDSATTKKELQGYHDACPAELLPALISKMKKLKK